ncbi:hypothetical protein [Streptomyces sp. NPDC057909]|uniref:hypothetical protein n=1 Tax=Streptomyces sp. NPDC057909 TaxID=3346277 RepID=UPI0036EF7C12
MREDDTGTRRVQPQPRTSVPEPASALREPFAVTAEPVPTYQLKIVLRDTSPPI